MLKLMAKDLGELQVIDVPRVALCVFRAKCSSLKSIGGNLRADCTGIIANIVETSKGDEVAMVSSHQMQLSGF